MNQVRRCAAPWRGLHITPQGDLKTCCSGANIIGNINSEDIRSLLSKPILSEIRNTIKNGDLHPEYCAICIQSERGGTSERNWHNNINPDLDFDSDTHSPTLIDIRWNTTCNLACNYCGPFASSRWESRMQVKPLTRARNFLPEITDYVSQHRNQLKEVGLVGGEPLLLNENLKLLEIVPEHAVVTVITNCNVDFVSNQIVKQLLKRQRVGWSMSFDNVGERMEYVRHGANWPLTDQNVRTIVKHFEQGHWGGIHAVYSIFNCTRLRDLRQYANDVGIDIVWQVLVNPWELDPCQHSLALRDLALEEIEQYKQEFGLTDLEREFFTKIEKQLQVSATNQNASAELKKRIYKIEHNWHDDAMPNFDTLWPEIAQIL